MIDAKELLTDCRRVADALVDDLRARTEDHEASRESARLVYAQAQMAGRTDKTWEEWREDLLAQVASGWVLAAVFVRFCEDNRLVDDPLLSGPGDRGQIARDHRAEFFAANPQAGDREWLQEVFGRYRKLPAVSEVFGERNPLWQLAPSADGARELLELWWATDDGGTRLRHDFTDPDWGTRFLGDLYQDLSEHARKQYALLQTPDFVEEFILDRTLDPAITEFGLDGFKMIDPTCGSGHFLLGAFDRLIEAWREAEPGTSQRELAQRALDSVHGVDLNPFAVAIARFRLLVAALNVSGESRLENLPRFTLNLAVGDSLLHGSHPGMLFPPEDVKAALAHHYPTEDVDEADRLLRADSYHAVVGNPPYIAVSDKAARESYRRLYSAVSGHYTLVAPFMQRFFDLSDPDGIVGLIVGNGYLRREFGRGVIQEVHTKVGLELLVDSSIVPMHGHGTDTVILIGRKSRRPGRKPRVVVLDETEALPMDADALWAEVVERAERDGVGSGIASRPVEPVAVETHPIRLLDETGQTLLAKIEAGGRRLRGEVRDAGKGDIVGQDDVYVIPEGMARRQRIAEVKPFLRGDAVRDWSLEFTEVAIFPYSGSTVQVSSRTLDFLWPFRRLLQGRQTFSGGSYLEHGRDWVGWHQVSHARLEPHVARVAYPQVETSNHFVPLDPGVLANQSIRLLVMDRDHVEQVAGLLNSSIAGWWMNHTFAKKHSDVERWMEYYEFDATKMMEFPLPKGASKRLDGFVRALLADDRSREVKLAVQEELDWECYALYGLTTESLAMAADDVPPLQKGERAFEIALARRMAAGEVESTWFVRHGSTPITELPTRWPDEYRALVQRRLELIESDRSIRLLERPEYKRRWNWDELDEIGREAQRTWLSDRVEALIGDRDAEAAVTTVARLADRLAQDPEAVQVARDLAGASVDLVKLVGDLVADSAVPFLAAWRYTDSGLVKRRAWERTWDLQRTEDQLDARAALPEDDPDHLDESALKLARKEAGVEKIPVPPKYATKDFRDTVTYRMRGKLDVHKERFISYPGTKAGADTTAVIGWAGWDHLQQARALAGHYNTRKGDGAETDELVPLLAGLAELVPWLKQWHNEPDPTFGERMGDFFAGFVDSEAAAIGVTTTDLADWRPPAKTTRRRKKKASS